MTYYKIPFTSGSEFTCPAGSILCCMFYADGYIYAKFERVTTAGSDWVVITESEFNVRCPDFPAPEIPPVQAVIATTATIADNAIVLDLPAPVDTGSLVKFSAPCACSAVTGGLVIDGITYAVVDALGAVVTGKAGVWDTGALVAVLLDVDSGKAFLQNGSAFPNYGGTLHGPVDLTKGIHYFDSVDDLPDPGNIGRLYFVLAER